MVFFGVFLVPELRGRSLEEVDELYDAGLKWGWQFKVISHSNILKFSNLLTVPPQQSYETTGAGAQIAALENEDHEKLRGLRAKSIDDTNGVGHAGLNDVRLGDEKRGS